MARAFAERRFGQHARVDSAGLRPQLPEDAKNALDTLKFEFGIDAAGHRPKGIGDVVLDEFTDIIAMDKQIARDLRAVTTREIIVWDIHDPWGDDPAEYRRCALKIKQKIASIEWSPHRAAEGNS